MPDVAAPKSPLVVRRLFALLYDAFPVIALWMVASVAFTVGYTIAGHEEHQNIPPFSPLQWLLWITCWLIAGAYAVFSWHRGGQTLGMRPWRLHVTDALGQRAGWRALATRYVVATFSLALAGLGFWWAWIDRDRLTWHDRASNTRMQLAPKPAK